MSLLAVQSSGRTQLFLQALWDVLINARCLALIELTRLVAPERFAEDPGVEQEPLLSCHLRR